MPGGGRGRRPPSQYILVHPVFAAPETASAPPLSQQRAPRASRGVPRDTARYPRSVTNSNKQRGGVLPHTRASRMNDEGELHTYFLPLRRTPPPPRGSQDTRTPPPSLKLVKQAPPVSQAGRGAEKRRRSYPYLPPGRSPQLGTFNGIGFRMKRSGRAPTCA